MGSFGILHWVILIVVVMLLFGGRGKISDLMGDVAKGIKSFKQGMSDDDKPAAPPRSPDQLADRREDANYSSERDRTNTGR